MYKTKEEVIIIQAEEIDPIKTGAVFWSHDKGTAKMIFELQKNHVEQSLAIGTKVPILLEFDSATAENGRGKHTYFATIDDAVNGIVSIVLEDNILGYQGRVDGSIYIELPDSRSLDTAGRFSFEIKRSPIDENVPELEDYYWQGFNEIMTQYNQTIAKIKSESERLLNELQARILTLEEKLDNVELRARFKTAWSWSADGTDRFTKVYPGENYVLKSKEPYTATGNGLSNQYPASINNIPFNPDILGKQATIQYKLTISNYVSGERVNLKLYDAVGEWTTFGGLMGITGNVTRIVQWKGTLPPLKEGGRPELDFTTNLKADILIEKLRINKGTEYQFYTPAPSEDPINAYPTYKGISIVDSDNPADYSWQAEDNTIAKKTDLTKDKVGLGNVDNYSTATQAEAEAGTATNKFMTPALVFKAIAKWVQGKFVSIAGNETIGGIKNFRDGLMLNGLSVNAGMVERNVTDADRSDTTNVSNVAGELTRIGNLVFFTVCFKCDSYPTSATETRWVIKIPDGYKRNSGNPTQTSLSLTRNEAQPADARAYISQDSMVCVKSGRGYSYVSGMWVTKDAWPS